jgi:hypothetical protein
MAIVINGSGTVTGLSVGGLPDGTVDAGTLATNSVDSAELIDGAVDDSHIAALAASKLTGALPAISGASLTGITNNAGTAKFQAKGFTSGGGTWYAVASNTIIVMAGEHSDDDSCYNISDGKYTAPNAGVYFFYANIYTANADGSNGFAFRKNDSQTGTTDVEGTGTYSGLGTDDHSITMEMVISLGTDDTVAIYTNTGSDWYSGHSYWGGFRLK